MLRVAIIGAGQIAEAHIGEIAKINGAKVVALCDLMESPSLALAEKFAIPNTFTSTEVMLESIRPDVVHLTTPPSSHYSIGIQCIKAGSHIYVEKPLTLVTEECEKLIALANERGKKICLGANRYFSHAQMAVNKLLAAGELGKIIHIDSFFTYDLTGIFGKQILANPGHWIARLPGQVFQNNLNHPLMPILPHLSDKVEVKAWASDFSENDIVFDELRIRLIDPVKKITANLTFSSNVKPAAFRIGYYGSKSSIFLDNMNHSFQISEPTKIPGTLGQILAIKTKSRHLMKQFWRSLWRFVSGKETFFTDMRLLMEDFYGAIEGQKNPAITDSQLVLTSRIMDEVFEQIGRPGCPQQ